MSAATALEQYMLELINQRRAAAGVQPLAFNSSLNDSSELHTQWMLATDTFSHVGVGGSSETQRMQAAGYTFTGFWGAAENIAYRGVGLPTGLQDDVFELHTQFLNSSGHLANMLNASFREVGVGIERGDFTGSDIAIVTQNFGYSGTGSFVTGVAYLDRDGDGFYDVGEGLGGIQVTVRGSNFSLYQTQTTASGGYSFRVPDGSYTLEFSNETFGTISRSVTVSGQNNKSDLVAANSILATTVSNLGDFNGDGRDDVLLQHTSGGMAEWLMNGSTPSGYGIGPIASSWHALGVGDFNGDGRDDILFRNDNGSIAQWQMNGAQATPGTIGSLSYSYAGLTVAGIGDFNGDNMDDILWLGSDGQVFSWLMNGNVPSSGNGNFGPLPASWHIQGVGDFNGDGLDDVLLRSDNGTIAHWQKDGTFAAATAVTHGNIGNEWTTVGVGDFNGDGRADILWRNTNGTYAQWQMTATGPLGLGIGLLGNEWSVEAIGDLNGDNMDDIIFRSTDGAVVEWQMNGTTPTGLGIATVGYEWTLL